MKVNFKYAMLAVAALTLGLTSCSNDNDDVTTGSGQEAKVNISVTSPAGSRAVATDPATVPTDKVNNFSVFIVDGDKLYKGYSSDGNSLSGTNAISATTTSSGIYVIANAGDLTSEITTVAGLTGYTADLNGTKNQMGTDGRWATGKVNLTPADFSKNGDKYEATKPVALTFIAARITVKVVNQMDHYGDPGSLTLTDIAVINARGQSLLFPGSNGLIPTTYATGKKFYQGVENASFAFYPTSDFTMAETLLKNPLGDLTKDTYYYYVFENDATTAAASPTIVTLIGKDKDNKALYWPVHLAPYEQWTGSGSVNGITCGNSYELTITLKGDATGGDDGGGGEDPTNPVVKTSVNVSVTLTPWNIITLSKEF